MSGEIELVSDGDGLAIIGHRSDVERFVESAGLVSRDLNLGRLAQSGAVLAQTASNLAESSGRWVQLTKESAEAVRKYGLMDTKTPGVKHAMIGRPGDIKQWIQIAKTPGSLISNPALLSGAAGVMTQMAMQQQMEQITEYLATIDAKLDGVLRSQTNQVLARMDGVDLALREANKVKESVGRVSEVTWSKVQSTSTAVMETQGYALRQLADLADRIEEKAKIEELAEVTAAAEAEVLKWLRVLARCFQLHDAIAVLELDRVLDSSPDELDRHRLGLQAARADRLELILQSSAHLLGRMSAAAHTANSNVLLHPRRAPAIVASNNRVASGVHGFHEVLGITGESSSFEVRRWVDAADEKWDKVVETSVGGIETVKELGGESLSQARAVASRLVRRTRLHGRKRGSTDSNGLNEH